MYIPEIDLLFSCTYLGHPLCLQLYIPCLNLFYLAVYLLESSSSIQLYIPCLNLFYLAVYL
jgi:hypothetical protein